MELLKKLTMLSITASDLGAFLPIAIHDYNGLPIRKKPPRLLASKKCGRGRGFI